MRYLLTLVFVFPSTVLAQSSWVGQRVITHYGAVLKVGNQVVDDQGRGRSLAVSGTDRRVHRVYRVEQVNGSWLWLKAEDEGVAGWVKAEYVIPYDQAIEYFANQIRANPSQSRWYVRRGNVWSDKGEYDIAIADFNEAIRLDPNDALAFSNRGIAWKRKTEYDKAIADFNEAIRLDPKYATAFNNRGIARQDKKEHDKAIADFNEAIRLDPKYAYAFNNRGIAWQDKKEHDKAIADFNEAIRLDPKYAYAFNNRGNAWQDKKEHDKAIADFNEAIRLDPKFATAFYNRAIAWQDKKEYDKAIADYSEAISLDPKDASAFSNRAWLSATCPDAKFRDGQKAFADASQACQLSEWKDADCIGALAAAYAECRDFEKAVEYQDKAIKKYTEEEDKTKGEERVKLYREKKPYREE